MSEHGSQMPVLTRLLLLLVTGYNLKAWINLQLPKPSHQWEQKPWSGYINLGYKLKISKIVLHFYIIYIIHFPVESNFILSLPSVWFKASANRYKIPFAINSTKNRLLGQTFLYMWLISAALSAFFVLCFNYDMPWNVFYLVLSLWCSVCFMYFHGYVFPYWGRFLLQSCWRFDLQHWSEIFLLHLFFNSELWFFYGVP